MSINLADDGTIRLEGHCLLEDGEVLLRLLSSNPGADVDWSACEQAHTAVIQVMMAVRPRIVGYPTNSFLYRHLAPMIGEAS